MRTFNNSNRKTHKNKIKGTPILKLAKVKRLQVKRFVKKFVKNLHQKTCQKKSSKKIVKKICQKNKKFIKQNCQKIGRKIRLKNR